MCEWPKEYIDCGPACHDICGVKTCQNYTTDECFEQCACPAGTLPPDCKPDPCTSKYTLFIL